MNEEKDTVRRKARRSSRNHGKAWGFGDATTLTIQGMSVTVTSHAQHTFSHFSTPAVTSQFLVQLSLPRFLVVELICLSFNLLSFSQNYLPSFVPLCKMIPETHSLLKLPETTLTECPVNHFNQLRS